MELLRLFWDAAVALDPGARPLHEGSRFPLCNPDALRSAFLAAGFESIEVASLTVPTPFESFEDYWLPIANGPGPAPTYLSTLPGDRRQQLEDRLRAELVGSRDGSIHLSARAWAVKGLRGAPSTTSPKFVPGLQFCLDRALAGRSDEAIQKQSSVSHLAVVWHEHSRAEPGHCWKSESATCASDRNTSRW